MRHEHRRSAASSFASFIAIARYCGPGCLFAAGADHARVLVWVQNPLAIPGPESAPQPDIAWVAFRRYADRRPLPEEVSLVIEVADTSLEFDTTAKAGLYAAAGIADYWVVDLVSRAVIVLREPRAGDYESRSTHRGDQLVRPLAAPQAVLSPAELFLPGHDGQATDPPWMKGFGGLADLRTETARISGLIAEEFEAVEGEPRAARSG